MLVRFKGFPWGKLSPQATDEGNNSTESFATAEAVGIALIRFANAQHLLPGEGRGARSLRKKRCKRTSFLSLKLFDDFCWTFQPDGVDLVIAALDGNCQVAAAVFHCQLAAGQLTLQP